MREETGKRSRDILSPLFTYRGELRSDRGDRGWQRVGRVSQRFPLVMQRGQALVACSCCTCAIIGRGTSPHSLRLSPPKRPKSPTSWRHVHQLDLDSTAAKLSRLSRFKIPYAGVGAGNEVEILIRSRAIRSISCSKQKILSVRHDRPITAAVSPGFHP